MQIRQMTATFGKLHQQQMKLKNGLNLIYAPNESGKSTWCQFLRTMFYGFPQRERGEFADKNRFAPWDGSPMSGTMDIVSGTQEYTISRSTERASAPMGSFSCTYTGTGTPVPGVDAQNAGLTLLGVERSVFSRSAFIGQSGLALDQDAALEQRLSSLITTGEEDVSFTESYDRLKKQRNRRRHNKTGLLPALEQEISLLHEQLDHRRAVSNQLQEAQLQLQQTKSRVRELQSMQQHWRTLEYQSALARCDAADKAAQEAQDHFIQLEAAAAKLPSEGELSQLLGMAEALQHSAEDADAAAKRATDAQSAAQEAQRVWQSHPLYPAQRQDLADRLQKPVAGKLFSPLMIVLPLIAGIAAGAALWFLLHQTATALLSGFAALLIVLLIYIGIRRRKLARDIALAKAQRDHLAAEAEQYLRLQKDAEDAAASARHDDAAARGLQQSTQENRQLFLDRVNVFGTQSDDVPSARMQLSFALRQRRELDEARQAARDAATQSQLLRSQLPEQPAGTSAEGGTEQPPLAAQEIAAELPRRVAEQQAMQSRVDDLTGQLRTLGEEEFFSSQLQEKEREQQRLQDEYNTITMAMEALERANTTLQNRFSPALGQRSAEIFSALTGGKYHQVVLNRDFSLSAQSGGDPLFRNIRLLSQGTADQLYLAVRLAVCDMVLPADDLPPLILDDALANFDDGRMAQALDYLADEGQRRQILLFTCQKREGTYLSGRDNIHRLTLA